LVCDRVVLAFDDLSKTQRDIFHFGDETELLKMAGDGVATITITATLNGATVEFKSRYADTTNTVDFGGQRVQFSNSGRLLTVGAQSVRLEGPQQTVHIKAGKIAGLK